MHTPTIIHAPLDHGPVRALSEVPVAELITSLQPFIDLAHTGVTQQALRTVGDFHGLDDLRDHHTNPLQHGPWSFKDWVPGTEYLAGLASRLGISVRGRVRLLMMLPRTTYSLHHDLDLWRLHIPLVTNPQALMFVNGRMWHLPVGWAYLVHVGQDHLALNAGLTDRIHVVFDSCAYLAE